MRRLNSYINRVSVDMVHLVQIQTAFRFDTEKLANEIRNRTHAVVDVAEASGASCYNLLVASTDTIPAVLEVVLEIEKDVRQAREQKRLLGLCVAD